MRLSVVIVTLFTLSLINPAFTVRRTRGLASARQPIEVDLSFRHCTKLSYTPPPATQQPCHVCMLENAEDGLLRKVINNEQNVLQPSSGAANGVTGGPAPSETLGIFRHKLLEFQVSSIGAVQKDGCCW